MRKILIFSLVYYPKHVAGAEVAIKEITDRIPSSEIEFDMVTLNGGNESDFEKVGNISVYRILKKVGTIQKLLYPFAAFMKAIKLHKKNKYDLVWSMMASYAGYAGFLFKKKNKSVPFVLSIQEGENFGRRKGLKFLFGSIFKNADRIQVISKFLEDWSREMGARCPITIVPNGVDFNFFAQRKSEVELAELKNKLRKNQSDVFLISTSRLVPKNAYGDVIDALQYLPINVKFLILGQGYLEKILRDRVTKLHLNDRVKFLGFIPHAEMRHYLHVSDIFIRPALSEGFGLSYIEAMAAGIPVITTPVGGIVDFLRDGETGLFCEVRNPKSVAQKVEKLIKDKESRDYIIRNAEQMVKERYEWNIIANMMKNEVFLNIR